MQMDYRKRVTIYSTETSPRLTGHLKNQSGTFLLLLKNKRNVKIISLWLHNTKLEVQKVFPKLIHLENRLLIPAASINEAGIHRHNQKHNWISLCNV